MYQPKINQDPIYSLSYILKFVNSSFILNNVLIVRYRQEYGMSSKLNVTSLKMIDYFLLKYFMLFAKHGKNRSSLAQIMLIIYFPGPSIYKESPDLLIKLN